MSLLSLEKAILLTLSYSAVFSFPLTADEIWQRLIGGGKKMVVLSLLEKMVKQQKLIKNGEHFLLPKSVISPRLRKERKKIAQQKIVEAQKFVDIAKKIPFVSGLVITGSLSVDNTKLNDDVDWLIICQQNRLWLVRPLVILIAAFLGKRRQRNGNHRDNSWCFNMFMETGFLSVTESSRNIYTAYEVCQTRFVFDQGGVEKKFLHDNKWAGSFLPNYYQTRLKKISSEDSFTNLKKENDMLTILNKIGFSLQHLYMWPKMTREKVSVHAAFFHPRDTRGEINKKWLNILNRAA